MTRLMLLLIITALVGFKSKFFISVVTAAELPPSVVREQSLHDRLEKSYLSKGKNYAPRTQHKTDGQPKYVNRLIEEVSPYLLQHAHNPVDWYSWSDEALKKASDENKLIFLSIGYAACYWCHVMERESFDQEDVAKVLNESFISIKIDREEKPDLDHLYLTATRLQQGQAGWPNTLWLTPDGKPFHTGTYFSKEELIQTSSILAEGWRSPSSKSEIIAVANGLSGQVKQIIGGGQGNSVPLNEVIYHKALKGLLNKHNELEGGFSEVNQFPQEAYLLFLLDHWRRGGSEDAMTAVLLTLDAIAAGGIQDHVGGGFHRYAIDPSWETPHFEKMLYNQALLSRVFLEAWQASGKVSYRRAAERTLQYITRDMTSPDGAFYAAEGADSLNYENQFEEGAFYTWESDELLKGLNGNKEMVELLSAGSHPVNGDPIVLQLGLEEEIDFEKLDSELGRLLEVRSTRDSPFKDKKIIAGWNGLMIRSLATAGVVFNNKSYLTSAEIAGHKVWEQLWDGKQLGRFFLDGKRNGDGQLEDYVWLSLGYISLFDATNVAEWLNKAEQLAKVTWDIFSTKQGRLKQASLDGPFGPVFGAIDDATPSGESSAMELYSLLIHRTGDLRYYSWFQKIADGLSTTIARKPEDFTYALMANRLPLDGESTQRQTRGNGNVTLHLTRDKLILDIKEGWHLSAHLPGYDYLIGTKITGAKARWPQGEKIKLDFATQEAFVYEGKLEIPLELTSDSLTVTVQACSDKICLTPEEAVFRMLPN